MRFPLSWWQTLWVLLFLSGLVFRTRSAADIGQDPLDGWALLRVGLVFIAALVLFLRLTLRRSRWTRSLFSGVVGVFLLYPVFSLVSTAWSVSPPWTFYKSVEFLTDVLLLATIVATLETVEEYRRLVNLTLILLGLLIASAWIGAVIDPSDALFADSTVRIMTLPARLVGVFPIVSCNELSAASAILGLIALCRLFGKGEGQKHRIGYQLLFMVAMVTLVITQTRGAFAAFFIGLVLLLILLRRFRLAAVAGISSFLLLAALLLFTHFGKTAQDFLMRGQTADQASGISGRAEIWQDAFDSISEHPWMGYGGFAGARFVVLSRDSMNSSSLNGYIDSALNLGVSGPLILLIVVVGLCRGLLKSIDRSDLSSASSSLGLEMFMAFVIIFVSSFESSDIITHPPLTFLAILGAAEVLRRHRKSLAMERFAYELQAPEEPLVATGWNGTAASAPPLAGME